MDLKSLLILCGIFVGLFNFTGCSYKNINNDSSKISQIELEENLNNTVQTYFEEKYGVRAVITRQAIAGGVFLGPDPSAEQYYNLSINIIDDEYYTECRAEVYERQVNNKSELYVKNESYYGKYMDNKMLSWIDSYILKTGLKDYIIEYSGKNICFPCEYSTDLTAEKFIELISANENINIRRSAYFILTLPDSEYEKHMNLSEELYELKSDLGKFNGGITMYLIVYNDMDFNQIKNGNKSHFDSIVSTEILNCTE